MNSDRNSRRNAGETTAPHGKQGSGSNNGESQSTVSASKFAGCLLLIIFFTAPAYCRVPSFQYLNWDDNIYVSRRPEIHNGLTLSGLRWAFSTWEAGNWHPLVWVSYMCEIEVFGIDSGVMHVVNLALHLVNTALVAILIRRLTGNSGSALAVAAIFGVHPQHVEADRYMYFPHIGLFLMLTAIPDLTQLHARRFAAAGLSLGLLIYGHATFQQTAVWHDSISLWQSVLLNDPDSYRAHEHLATALLEAGRTAEAAAEAAAEARIALGYSENCQSSQSYMTLGTSLLRCGQTEESVEYLRQAVIPAPGDAVAVLHLAYALRETESAEALVLFERARTLDAQNVECIAGLANSSP